MTAWLESAQLPIQPSVQDDSVKLAIRAWNMMGGMIDWVALPTVAEVIGFEDMECLLAQLTVIRDHGKQ